MENLRGRIQDRLDELTIEKWWDYSDYEEIRDKDYVAECIYEDVLEAQDKVIEYLERKYGIVINKSDLDNFLNREI